MQEMPLGHLLNAQRKMVSSRRVFLGMELDDSPLSPEEDLECRESKWKAKIVSWISLHLPANSLRISTQHLYGQPAQQKEYTPEPNALDELQVVRSAWYPT